MHRKVLSMKELRYKGLVFDVTYRVPWSNLLGHEEFEGIYQSLIDVPKLELWNEGVQLTIT